ncbi:helix-turn-helix domain-containing protein [Mycoplasmopsis gallinarum]|uniref:helix-turn-helix domain-containing protein n=1 Tax=Mycoplasmopsis gallinarum TaxID=29557 RepID=UPI0007C5D555|nr:helix-turn-helix transcriptional regulator [Mycoplasmopsis gallinarum]
MNYARMIKNLRDKLIMTQEEFANLLGVSITSVNRWETKKHLPTTKAKRKIVELCKQNNVNTEDIVWNLL